MDVIPFRCPPIDALLPCCISNKKALLQLTKVPQNAPRATKVPRAIGQHTEYTHSLGLARADSCLECNTDLLFIARIDALSENMSGDY
jgi:hypothetical protein